MSRSALLLGHHFSKNRIQIDMTKERIIIIIIIIIIIVALEQNFLPFYEKYRENRFFFLFADILNNRDIFDFIRTDP